MIRLKLVLIPPLFFLFDGFPIVLQTCMSERGTRLKINTGNYTPQKDKYTITYTARRSLGFKAYLRSADVKTWRNGESVAHATWSKSKIDTFTRYDGTEAKLCPAYNELFKNYSKK